MPSWVGTPGDLKRQDTGTIPPNFTRAEYWYGHGLHLTVTGSPLIPAHIMRSDKAGAQSTAGTHSYKLLVCDWFDRADDWFVKMDIWKCRARYICARNRRSDKAAAIVSLRPSTSLAALALVNTWTAFPHCMDSDDQSIAFAKLKLGNKWVTVLGITGSVIYLLAQAGSCLLR